MGRHTRGEGHGITHAIGKGMQSRYERGQRQAAEAEKDRIAACASFLKAHKIPSRYSEPRHELQHLDGARPDQALLDSYLVYLNSCRHPSYRPCDGTGAQGFGISQCCCAERYPLKLFAWMIWASNDWCRQARRTPTYGPADLAAYLDRNYGQSGGQQDVTQRSDFRQLRDTPAVW
jgi:hypothetical protein